MKGLKDLSVATDNDETAESSIVNGTIEVNGAANKGFRQPTGLFYLR